MARNRNMLAIGSVSGWIDSERTYAQNYERFRTKTIGTISSFQCEGFVIGIIISDRWNRVAVAVLLIRRLIGEEDKHVTFMFPETSAN